MTSQLIPTECHALILLINIKELDVFTNIYILRNSHFIGLTKKFYFY